MFTPTSSGPNAAQSSTGPKLLVNPADRRKTFNNPNQTARRKIAREVSAMWGDIGAAMGFTPIELRTAWAIEVRIDEMGRGPDSPRWVTNAAIGLGLVSNTKDIEHAKRTARNRVGHLFNKAIPRTGYQIMTRYMVGDDEQHPNEFVSHLMPVASFFSELLAEEFKAINKLDSALRGAAKAEARERIIAEALTYLPKCEAVILEPDGETVYAYVSGPEAKAYCDRKPEYKTRAYQYQEPEAKKPKPFYSDDFDRLIKRAVKEAVDQILDAIGERNGKDTARAFWTRKLLPALEHAGERWVNYCRVDDDEEEEKEEREEREIELPSEENPVLPPDREPPDSAEGGEEKLSSLTLDNSAEDNNLRSQFFDSVGAEASADDQVIGDDQVIRSIIEVVGSINFDSALDAARWYAGGGLGAKFPVLPVCQSKPGGGCSWGKHDQDCTGRKPLVKGDQPGGYSGASPDLDIIEKWFTGQFADQGVAIRLDDHVALDADVKDNAGGLESYAILRDTFGLEETLTQVTHSGGAHFVFKLPEGLPAGWLKSWVRVGNKVGLPGLDLKVHTGGLLFVEPTMGPRGHYRWVNVDAPIATLPRECCDYLHKARYTETPEEKAKAAKASARVYTSSSSSDSRQFDHDQSKYFRDVPEGDRHARLLTVGNAIRRQTRASAAQIAEAMRYHAAHFSSPLNDETWIRRTSAALERGF